MENSPVTYQKAMEQAQKENWNILTPAVSMEGLSEYHKAVVEVVRLSPNKDDGDVYPASNKDDDEGGKLRLSGKGIEKLGMAACVMWNLDYCKRTDGRTDDNYVSWQSVGGIRKPDGTIVWMKAEYDLDLTVLEEEMEQQAIARFQKASRSNQKWTQNQNSGEYAAYCISRDMPQKRKHKLKLAETGARNRVIRALLGLRNEYAAADLKKPFVLARIVLQPDYNDPVVKQAVLTAYLQSTMGVYGGGSGPGPVQGCAPVDIPKEDYRVMDPDEPAPENGDDIPPDKRESAITDFQNLDDEHQLSNLQVLIKKKGYDYEGAFKAAGKKVLPIGKLLPEIRLKYFSMLIDLPDAPDPNQDDDIPF